MAVERDGSSRRRSAHARRLAASLLAAAAGLSVASAAAAAPAPAAPSSSSSGAFATEWVGGRLRVVPISPGQASTYRAAGAGGYATTERGTVVRALGTNDPLRPEQWALDRVSFESAWAITQGQGVKVAVIDSGVRGDHQDLAGTVLPGIDFVSPGGNGWNDRNGHGTHVAGIVAAAANNGVGVAGGAPRVKILPVRVLAADGSGSSENVTRGIIWAVDHGARVINLSLGGPDPSPGTEAAIQYANSRGVIVLAAAGNGAQQGNRPSYPAAFPETVAVGAVDSNLTRAYFSNFGSYLDIAAPGMHVLSTYGLGHNAYAYMNGTSMATPYASATAALVVSVNPALSANGIRSTIQHTAIDLGPPGPDVDFGSGLIDPHAAVLQAIPKPAGFGTKGHGYWVVSANGSVRAFGRARFAGDLRGRRLPAPIVASAATRTGRGYWLAGADGSVYAFGDATYYGGMGGRGLRAPIVGMSVTPTGRGYFLLGDDGGIFNFGDAKFRGSTGAMRLRSRVLDMTVTRSGKGYFLVASDGGVFTFGDAKFRGSTGTMRLRSPIVSMSAGRRGYWLVARDGGIFAFKEPFVGSLPTLGVQQLPAGVRIRALPDGRGYYVLGADGSVFTFGTARFFGSAAPLSFWTPAVDLMLVP